MKDLYTTIRGGGDEAVAALKRISEDWRVQLEAAADEVERLRLTDEEREAVAASMIGCVNERTHATLRGLLERMK